MSHELTVEHKKLLNLSTTKTRYYGVHGFAEFVWFSFLKVNSTTKSCCQDRLQGKTTIHPTSQTIRDDNNHTVNREYISLLNYTCIWIAWLMWKLNVQKHTCTNNSNALYRVVSPKIIARYMTHTYFKTSKLSLEAAFSPITVTRLSVLLWISGNICIITCA